MSFFKEPPSTAKCEAQVRAELYAQRGCPQFARTVVDELNADHEARRRHQALFLSARSTLQRHERQVATWRGVGRAVGFCLRTPFRLARWVSGRIAAVTATIGEAAQPKEAMEPLETVAYGDLQLARQLVSFFDNHPEAQDEIPAVYKHVLEIVVGADGDTSNPALGAVAESTRRVAVR